MTLYLILKSKRLQLLPENLIMVTMLHARLATKKIVFHALAYKNIHHHYFIRVYISVLVSLERRDYFFLVFCTLFLSSLMLINRHFGEEVRDKFFSRQNLLTSW